MLKRLLDVCDYQCLSLAQPTDKLEFYEAAHAQQVNARTVRVVDRHRLLSFLSIVQPKRYRVRQNYFVPGLGVAFTAVAVASGTHRNIPGVCSSEGIVPFAQT